MLTGRAPFDGEAAADTLAAVIYKEPEPLAAIMPNAPPELQRILRKALQKDREERYQSVKDLAFDVKDLLHDLEHANSGEPRLSHNVVAKFQRKSDHYPSYGKRKSCDRPDRGGDIICRSGTSKAGPPQV